MRRYLEYLVVILLAYSTATWANGTLSISKSGSGGGGTTITRITKGTTESVTSSTTLQDDDELTFAVSANTTYWVEFWLVLDATTLGDVKVMVDVPTSTTGWWGLNSEFDDQVVIDFDGSTLFSDCDGTGIYTVAHYVALVEVQGTAGNVTLQWAQQASNGTASNINADSFLTYITL